MINTQKARDDFIRLQVNKENIENEYLSLIEKNQNIKNEIGIHEKSKEIISRNLQIIQSDFKNQLEGPVNEVISHVYQNRDFKFSLDVKEKANSYEWNPKIIDNGEPVFDIKNDSGGLVSIIGFVFKIVFHLTQSKNLRNVLVFDEPVSNIGVLTEKFGEIIVMLSKKYGIQFIIATHSEDLMSLEGKGFKIKYNGEFSELTEV